MDCLKIPGFGTKLIRFDYPPDPQLNSAWGGDHMPHQRIKDLLDCNANQQKEYLKKCLAYAEICSRWPQNEDQNQPTLPWRENEFLTLVDQLTLYGMLRELSPKRYIEIGSGMSTRIAWQARKDGGFPMEIISIDPGSRIQVSNLCDTLHPHRLEEVSEKLLSMVTPDTVLFFDGSHCCFPSSDVTCFFLNILPELPAGAVVHIHDIFLPFDYPTIPRQRYWSEQYLLAAFLLGGASEFEAILPVAYLSSQEIKQEPLKEISVCPTCAGSSFWMKKHEKL
jgi:hypothetical protein